MKLHLLACLVFLVSIGALSSAEDCYSYRIVWDWINPDGVWRSAFVFEDVMGQRHFPGPTLEANLDDVLCVNFTNGLPTETITIHWHGLKQRKSPNMDGTAFITQYPIGPGASFTYVIPLDGQYGTYWYHSHSGTQYADGMYGMLIVRNTTDYYAQTYNIVKDYPIMFTEWYHRPATIIDAELTGGVWKDTTFFPDWESGLINGKNVFNCTRAQKIPPSWETQDNTLVGCVPGAVYELISVTAGSNYRLRVLNAASGFTFKFSIDGHNLTVVAIDGIDIQPVTVDEVYVYVAQRYDIVLQTHPTNPGKNFWMRARTFPLRNDSNVVGEVKAILTYSDTNDLPTTTRQTNPTPLVTNDNLELLEPEPLPGGTNPGHQVNISLLCDKSKWVCYANNISFQNPTVPAILSDCQDKDPRQNNPRTQGFNINYDTVVDIILTNLGTQSHPVHLHGHHFFVLGQGGPNSTFTSYSQLNLNNPVLRDTIQLEELSWAVLRFKADNPGVWVFHCHIEWHLESGMLFFFNEATEQLRKNKAVCGVQGGSTSVRGHAWWHTAFWF